MQQLVKLNKRPKNSGRGFTYILRYCENGKRKWETLSHTDRRKAERQRTQKEKELRMGYVEPGRIRLKELLEDYLEQTKTQIEPSTANSAARQEQAYYERLNDAQADREVLPA